MSTVIDNITLALLSLKKGIQDYLDSNGWQSKYSCFLAGDSDFVGKELVLKVVDKSKHIGLPVIIIEDSSVRNEVTELGTYGGSDLTDINFNIIAADNTQLRTLANLIRRYVTDRSFDIYDYTSPIKKVAGKGVLSNTFLTNTSDWSAVSVVDRNQAVVSSVMETSFDSLI